MVKFIFEIGSVDYNSLIDRIMQMVKDNPELTKGIKVPKFAGKMVKKLPESKKNEMLAEAVNGHKAEYIPQLEGVLSREVGPVRIGDLSVKAEKDSLTPLAVSLVITSYSPGVVINNFLPTYYDERTAPRIFDGIVPGPKSFYLTDVQDFLISQEHARQELLIAKSISVNKAAVGSLLTSKLAQGGLWLSLNNIRVLVKS